MHAVSNKSYYSLACSPRANIEAPAFYSIIMSPLTVSQGELQGLQLPTAMSDSQSINTLFLHILLCFKNEQVFIHDLTDLTLTKI
jgi:hypothetical protein